MAGTSRRIMRGGWQNRRLGTLADYLEQRGEDSRYDFFRRTSGISPPAPDTAAHHQYRRRRALHGCGRSPRIGAVGVEKASSAPRRVEAGLDAPP